MKATLQLVLFHCARAVLSANATNESSDSIYPSDPYLDYRPAFARSLPIQILLTGIVLTLVTVLFIHLIFTAQYHWPLAPINYALQVSGVSTLLISLIATLHVVLSATVAESRKWPYMISYVAVNVPPSDDPSEEGPLNAWTKPERATWFVMNATTSGLIQITHIHFLTLLFPSRLEGRLIYASLGPLALAATVAQLLPITNNSMVSFVASAIKNVANATLSLLFTAALFIWGLLVNRKQAWRTDGGTAAFGAAALSLAIISTALTFLYVPHQEEYLWLPGLIWAVILWQSFLGWWWWVGAGSGASGQAMKEVLRREEKKRKRKEAKAQRKNTKKKPPVLVGGSATGALVARPGEPGERTLSRRTSAVPLEERERQAEARRPEGTQDTEETQIQSSSQPNSHETEDLAVQSSTSDESVSTLPSFLPEIVHRWYASLRQAHYSAARKQAQERVERIRELGREVDPAVARGQYGWGLGSFGLRLGNVGEGTGSSRRRSQRQRTSRIVTSETEDADEPSPSRQQQRSVSPPPGGTNVDGPVEEVEMDALAEDGRTTNVEPHVGPNPPDREDQRPRSMFWWGPLRRWRLQDSTVY